MDENGKFFKIADFGLAEIWRGKNIFIPHMKEPEEIIFMRNFWKENLREQ
jgi:hypothetical protein